MPVRIIFRGLMLFQIPETGSNAGKLVAYLINNPEFAGGSKAHDHDAEVQILTGAEKGVARVPKVLKRDATLDIVAPGETGVSPSPSFVDHVPELGAIIAKATPELQSAGRGAPNRDLIQNVVTVNRGIVRVRDVTVWDQGGYPLSGKPNEVGQRATSPAVVKFMGSSVRGHLATEVIVEIDAERVQLNCEHDKRFHVKKKGNAKPSDPHIPARTVEILVSNYERPADKPTPWGLDFQWLFEAAGYGAADLAGSEFTTWVGAGRAFDQRLFDFERRMFLTGPQNTVGRPFPYIESIGSLTTLQPLTNYPKILVCVHAQATGMDTTIQEEAVRAPDGSVVMREWKIDPAARAAERRSAKRKTSARKKAVKKTPAKPKKSAKSSKPAAKK